MKGKHNGWTICWGTFGQLQSSLWLKKMFKWNQSNDSSWVSWSIPSSFFRRIFHVCSSPTGRSCGFLWFSMIFWDNKLSLHESPFGFSMMFWENNLSLHFWCRSFGARNVKVPSGGVSSHRGPKVWMWKQLSHRSQQELQQQKSNALIFWVPMCGVSKGIWICYIFCLHIG